MIKEIVIKSTSTYYSYLAFGALLSHLLLDDNKYLIDATVLLEKIKMIKSFSN